MDVSFQGIVHFFLSGEGGGELTVSVDGDTCIVTDTIVGNADIIVRSEATIYQAIEYGKKNPMQAILLGEVKVSNFTELISFTQSFRGLLSKKNN